ncbi:glycosyltransferase family 4 protein [Ideonella sp. YS5]|uniref:glycosyltransferase family 4 protein n=1 Tax=Ideonella sp. YS5 TaxID=3453714 RepID=UPI003EE9C563
MNAPLLRMLRKAFGTNHDLSNTQAASKDGSGDAATVTATSTGHIVDLRGGVPAEAAWQPVKLAEGRAMLLRSLVDGSLPIDIAIDWRLESAKAPAGFTGSVRFFDATGNPLPPPYAGCQSSRQDPAFLVFRVSSGSAPGLTPREVQPPRGARRLEIRWRADDTTDGISLASTPRITQSVPAAPKTAESTPKPATQGTKPARLATARTPRRTLAGWVATAPLTVQAGDVLVWRGRLEDPDRAGVKAAVISISMSDESGSPVDLAAVGVSHSARYPNFFYARSFRPESAGWTVKAFQVPAGVASLKLDAFVEAGGPALRLTEVEFIVLNVATVTRAVQTWVPHRAWIDPAIQVARAAGQSGLQQELLRLLGQTQSTSSERAVPGWPTALRIPVAAGTTLIWRARLEAEEGRGSPHAAVLAVSLIDATGLAVVARVEGLAHSDRVSNFSNVASHPKDEPGWSFASFIVPQGVVEVELDLRRLAEGPAVQVVDSSAFVLTVESIATILASWEPDAIWLEPAIRVAHAQGDHDLVRRLVRRLESERYKGLAQPHRWRRAENIRVAPGDVVVWRARLEDEAGAQPKAAILSVLAYDEGGLPVKGKWQELAHSARFGAYLYVPSHALQEEGWQFKSFVVKPGVSELGVDLHAYAASPSLSATAADLTVLTLESMAQMIDSWVPHEAWLEPALRLAQAEGALSLQMRLADLQVRHQAAKPEASRLWRAVRAELEELDTDWYPRIAARRSPPAGQGLTVCHLHKTAYPFENTGGAIRCLNTLKSQLEEGLDPFVITPPGYPAYDGVVDGNVLPREQVAGCDHFRIGPNTNGIRTLSPPARVRMGAVQAAGIVAQRGASLVHAASGIRGYELALQAFALRDVFDIPVIYEVRSFHEHTWAPAGPRVFAMERTQLRIRKENRCMAMADHVVTISESMRRILIERGVPEQKIDVIPNGIDAEEFREAPPPARIEALAGAQLVVGYVSNMSRREGHCHLVEAVARIRERGLDCRCLFVGDGPERKNLEQLVQQLGLAEAVHFAGEVDHHEIKAYYMAIDVFVIPRIPDYAADWVTPLKPYEAMALSRPLIVTDLPALREVVGDGERGLIAEASNADSLAATILRYAGDPALRDEMASRARDWVFEHRTWKANARRYREMYLQVISRYRASRPAQRSQDAHTG